MRISAASLVTNQSCQSSFERHWTSLSREGCPNMLRYQTNWKCTVENKTAKVCCSG